MVRLRLNQTAAFLATLNELSPKPVKNGRMKCNSVHSPFLRATKRIRITLARREPCYVSNMKIAIPLMMMLVVPLALIGNGVATAADAPSVPGTNTPGSEPATPVTLEKRSLKDCLLPAVKNGGFRMDGQILWCSSVIKVGDTYHMFASRWPAQYGLGGWTSHSECVRATSTNLLGPYTFQEVVLQKRTNNWDNSRVHNVKIVKAGAKFVLYYINYGERNGLCRRGFRHRPVDAPDETRHPGQQSGDPRPTGFEHLLFLAGCGTMRGVNRGIAFTAPTYEGPLFRRCERRQPAAEQLRAGGPDDLVGEQPIQHSAERLEGEGDRDR